MAKPTAAPALDEVERSAYFDLKAAMMEGGDDEAGMRALKDFVVACVRREMAEEYDEGE